MLNVYTYPIPRPRESIDLSMIPLNELADAVMDIFHHQTSVHLWFGYLDGWMLSPHEEVLLRKALRKFECTLVSFFPLSLSHAWQNEIHTLYTADPHGASSIDNHGGIVHDGSSVGHGHSSEQHAAEQRNHKNRKARSSSKRTVETGSHSSSNHYSAGSS